MSEVQRNSQIAAVRTWFGIDRGTACVLIELYKANGDYLSRHRLSQLCGVYFVSVRVRISELRQIMEAESIDTKAGCYGLTDVGMAECRQAFRAMADDITALLECSKLYPMEMAT